MQVLLFFFLMQLAQISGGFENADLEIRSYSPQKFGAHGQNWDILHASDGMLYTANRYGVLLYDGAEWSLVPSADRRAVLSLAEGSDGTIYAGAEQMFARLTVGDDGVIGFRSLNHLFPGSGPVGSVFHMAASDSGEILFTDQERIFLYAKNKISIPDSDLQLPLKSLETVGGEFAIIDASGSLFFFDGDGNGISRYNSDRTFTALIGMADGAILAATRSGLLLLSREHSEVTQLPVADELDYGSIQEIKVNGRSEIVAGTSRDGVYIFSPEGNVRHHLTAGNGLIDNAVNRLGSDRDGGVWVSQSRVLYRLGASTGIRVYSDAEGLYGIVEQTIVHNGSRYASGTRGLFRFVAEDKRGKVRIERVEGISVECFEMVSTTDGLLVACSSGIHLVDGLESRELIDIPGSIVLTESTSKQNRIYVGTTDGLYSLENSAGRWRLSDDRYPDVSGFIRHIVETDDGSVWVATRLNDLQRITWTNGIPGLHKVKLYGVANGLPDSRYRVFDISGEVIASTSDGLYRFDGVDSFYPDPRFFGAIPGDGMPNRMVIIQNGSILFSNGYDNGILVQNEGGSFETTLLAEGRFSWQLTFSVQPGEENTVWLGGYYGLANISLGDSNPGNPARTPILRQVASANADTLFSLNPEGGLRLENKLNGLVFSFTSPAFGHRVAEYRTRLMFNGSGRWNEWDKLQRREFSSLQSGSYEFQVQARTGAESESEIRSYSFAVLPPWYASNSAMVFWGIGLIGLVLGLISLRTARLKKYNLTLESTIRQRTEEIRRQKEQIEKQAKKLKRMDKLKSRFFTNISHEFRTPLTLIKGPLEDLLSGKYGPLNQQQHKLAALSQHNSYKLLHLINQLLELSKVEAGFVDLSTEEIEVDGFMKSIYSAFLPLAERHDVTFQYYPPPEPIYCKTDPDKLEKIVSNLLSNAFKAVRSEGVVKLDVSVSGQGEVKKVCISVIDNGVGIPEKRLSTVFDRYKSRQYTSDEGENAGTGIGLNLVRELSKILGGTINVESSPGIETRFCFQLPITASDSRVQELRKTIEEPGRIAENTGYIHSNGDNSQSREDVTTVLVVDDTPDVRDYIAGLLKDEFRVLEGKNGNDGLRLAIEHLPDLILSDVMMPEMDGREMVRQLKSNPETDSIPVIFLTARASGEQKVEGIATGVDDYLTKPFHPDEVLARVRNLLKNRTHLRQKYSEKLTVASLGVDVESRDHQFMKKLMAAVSGSLTDPEFSSGHLASELAMSPSALQRKIKAVCNMTPNQLIRKTRLSQARQLIENGADNMSEIAFAVGFNSLSYFTRSFKSEFGEPPTALKK